MLDQHRLLALAETVADGRRPDWDSADSSSSDEERHLIRHLRMATAVGRKRALACSVDRSLHRPAPPPTLSAGAEWGPLRILNMIGQGRFGDVYRAWDISLDREVALKILREPSHTPNAASTRVVEEGRLMARVRHPNVATIYGALQIDGVTGLWMEFVHGRTLEAELAERGPYDATELACVGVQLCEALAAVHDAGLIHRDVKTQNVMRDASGRIVLGDFGLGREPESAGISRRTGPHLAGTPVYLAPEVFTGHPASKQSDIYSLGTLLFRLATLRYPVSAQTLGELQQAHAAGRRTTLVEHRRDLPPALATAIDRALAADPAARFQDARDMARALAAGESARLEPRPARLALVGIAAAAMVVLTLGGLLARDGARDPAAPAGGEWDGGPVTTVSIEARALYSRAANLMRSPRTRSQAAAAEHLLIDATGHDPRFASAHLLLADVAAALDRPPDVILAHAARARRISGGVSRRERLLIAGRHESLLGAWTASSFTRSAHLRRAADHFEALAGLDPSDVEAHESLASVYMRLEEHARAGRVLSALADRQAADARLHARAAIATLRGGDVAGAARLAREAVRLASEGSTDQSHVPVIVWARVFPAHEAWLERDPYRAGHAVEPLIALLPTLPMSARRTLAVPLGDLALALGQLDRAETIAQQMPFDDSYIIARGLAIAQRGDRRALRDFLVNRRVGESGLPASEPWLVVAAQLLIEAELFDEARAVIGQLRNPQRAEPLAELDLAEGRTADAIARFDAVLPLLAVGQSHWLRAMRLSADAWQRRGDIDRAIHTLERASEAPRLEMGTGWEWLRLRASLADLYHAAGRTQEADEVARELRMLLAAADVDHPLRQRLRP